MSKFSLTVFAVILLLVFAIYSSRKTESPVSKVTDRSTENTESPVAVTSEPVPVSEVPISEENPPAAQSIPQQEPKKKKPLSLHYVISDGLAVVQGDVVVGTPPPGAPKEGTVLIPPMRPWATKEIAYYIQPNVVNPDRVRAALAMFDRTVIKFVPRTNESDALVFEDGTGPCKSFVGHIGGLQQIWIPSGCGPAEIAHEILHALGFIHEQNRADRDDYINVIFNNIEDEYRFNFEKLPPEFMSVSGLGSFDFNSLMIYPVWMFVKGGQATMESKVRDRPIQPSDQLSATDIERVNAAYEKLSH